MIGFLARRLLLACVTTWAVSVLAFVIIQLPPGDFVDAYIAQLAATGSDVTEQEADALRQLYGLDDPAWQRYVKWLGRIVRGEFGHSMEWNRPVSEVIGDRLWLTVAVSLSAVLFTWAIAFPIGIVSAVWQYSLIDYVATFIGFVGLAIPNFLLALLLMYAGFIWFDLDVGGLFSTEYQLAPWSWAKVWDLIAHLPIPAVVLGTASTAQLIRILRANLLDELRQPYVMTARARGLPEHRLILKYPVRAALNPFVSTVGYLLPFIVSGSIVISLVLSLPTVGPLLLRALLAQDMFLAGTIILLLGLLTIVGTLLSDLLLMWIDPRIRHGMQR